MSGHSKWSTIKRKKGALDAKRGKLFSKLNKEIMVAAKSGGGDLSANPRLRTCVQKARDNNMPMDNIERAIKKGTGDLDGVHYEEIMYEGYAQAGVALLVDSLTDNKNRTFPEVRNIFSKKGGNIANPGAVAWMFEHKGLIVVAADAAVEEALFELVLENGAEDLKNEGDHFEVVTEVDAFENVRKAIEESGTKYDSAELTYIPKNTVKVEDAEEARKILALVDALEDNDDVQNVYANFDISEEILKEQE